MNPTEIVLLSSDGTGELRIRNNNGCVCIESKLDANPRANLELSLVTQEPFFDFITSLNQHLQDIGESILSNDTAHKHFAFGDMQLKPAETPKTIKVIGKLEMEFSVSNFRFSFAQVVILDITVIDEFKNQLQQNCLIN